MDEADPLCLGGHGLSPLSDREILPLLAASDCVLLTGYDPIEMRAGWIRPWATGAAIELSHADTNHGMHASAMRLVGDIAALVAGLHAALPNTLANAAPVWPARAPAKARAALQSAFAGPGHRGPHAVFATLRAHLPRDGVVTVDSGAHRILLTQMWHCERPRGLL